MVMNEWKHSLSVSFCEYDLVLGTKYGGKIRNEGILSYMRERLKERANPPIS